LQQRLSSLRFRRKVIILKEAGGRSEPSRRRENQEEKKKLKEPEPIPPERHDHCEPSGRPAISCGGNGAIKVLIHYRYFTSKSVRNSHSPQTFFYLEIIPVRRLQFDFILSFLAAQRIRLHSVRHRLIARRPSRPR